MKNLLRKIVGQKFLNQIHRQEALLANLTFDFSGRELRVIGVTGTDGKTTTVNLIAKILQEGGHKTSFLTSINAQVGDQTFDTGLHTTTPSPFLLQKFFKRMVRAGSEFVVLEVTSHALDQFRTWGIKFETAVLTNITPEHLDYHETFEKYVAAKMKLFRNVKYRIANLEYRNLIKANDVTTYGFSSKAHIFADNIREELKSSFFTVHIRDSKFDIRFNLPGKFNVLNALAAISVAQVYNISAEQVISALAKISLVSGRMEYLDEGQDFLAMVDFAHTPNALKNLLEFLRPKITGRIILIFGSAGERDAKKRPQMGAIAGQFADLIVITREDNRSEKVEKICKEIVSGIRQKVQSREFFIIPDRREAIGFGLSHAQKNDIVVITGKGHEQSLNVDGKEMPWDDRKTMREELKKVVSRKS